MQRVLEFFKRHYEKMILCVVLLGLAWTAVWLPKMIGDAKNQAAVPDPVANPEVMPPLDVAPLVAVMRHVTNPPPAIFSGEHNLFNPVVWKRKPSGELLKILKIGGDALVVTNITPLYLIIGLDHPSGNGYYMFTQVQSGKRSLEYAKLNEKPRSSLYTLRAIKGAPEDPSQIQLEVPEEDQPVWISKDKPYQRVDGHTAYLKYDPESLSLPRKHVNDTFTLDGDQYKVVAITNNAVTVQQSTTGKQTTIRWNGSP